MNATLDKLIAALRQAGLEFSAESLADALWLAPHLPRTPPDQLQVRPERKPERPEKQTETKKDTRTENKKSKPETESVAGGKSAVDAQLPGPRPDDAGGTARGVPVRLPGAASLPEALAIARALRPLRKRKPTTRWFRLDEKRTAERLAAVDIWLPVLIPGRERWLNATIIVDAGASMAIWRSMVNEFRGLLQTLGAFRKVEVRRMDTDHDGDSVPVFASGQSTTQHDPLDLADPSGRSFFLIISDCVGNAWWDGRVARLLELWGRTNHTAVLQILPRAMWSRTGLGVERAVSLTSPRAVCPNANLSAYAKGKFQSNVKLATTDAVAVPVLEFGAASLACWARDAASATGARFSGRMLRTKPTAAPATSDDYGLGEPFLSVASVPARKLANLMAAAPPFNLPLLRVIRESHLSGEASQIHEAEFLLGGLLTAASDTNDERNTVAGSPPTPSRIDDPDSVIYDFKSPELRAMLRSAVHVSEAIAVMKLEEVGNYLDRHLGRPGFSAMFKVPENYKGALVLAPTEDRDPFARFTSDQLQWFGGKYAELLSVKRDEKKRSWGRQNYGSVIWFVQGSSGGEHQSQGSAVAVRIRSDRGTPRTYLLTCAHVVRSGGDGPVLDTMQAWRGGTRMTPDQARVVRVVATPHASPDDPIPDHQRAASFDWVLLEIEDKAEGLAAPAVPFWAGPDPAAPILVCGFRDAWFMQIVEPVITHRKLILHQSELGVLRLEGDDTQKGMSGGGLFDTNGAFVGIQRSSQNAELNLVAIAADFIRQRLKEIGFHVITDAMSAGSSPVEELARIMRDDAFRDVDWRKVLHRVLPNYSAPQNLVDDESLVAALQELEKHGPNTNGVHPLHEFAVILSRMNPVNLLREWIAKYVPPEKVGEQSTRPSISVLVAGTGQFKLPPAVYDTAARVGQWAASHDFGLVTGGWQGVDHVAGREFANSLDSGSQLELWLTHVVRAGSEPDFNRGRVVEVRTTREQFVRAIELTNAVILVGGVGGTLEVAEHAIRMRVPVFPLPWTDGDAARFHRHALANWSEHEWMGMPRDRFAALSNPFEALDIIAEHLQATREVPRSPPPPAPPDDAAVMLFVASKPPEGPLVRTDEELMAIGEIFDRARLDLVRTDIRFDVTWHEVQAALAAQKPVLLHFCGHSKDSSLLFRGASGKSWRVDPETFADTIGTAGGSLRVIVLNADATGDFANSVAKRLPDSVVIAPERVVTDDEAIRFAKDLYAELVGGQSVSRAFRNASYPREGGSAYTMWSNLVDPDKLSAQSGFADPHAPTRKPESELAAAVDQAMAALVHASNPEHILQAIHKLEAARRLVPHHVRAAILLGRLHRATDQLAEAIAVLTSAIDTNAGRPDSAQDVADLLYNRACYHALLGRKEHAFEDLIRSFRLYPRNAGDARGDEDFKSLREDRRFAVLLNDPKPHRVLIVGSLDSRARASQVSEFGRNCTLLGTALFNAGFGFVLGSYSENTADYHVLNGIDSERPANILYFRPRQELGRTDADEEGALVDHLVERNSPDAPWPVVRPMQVEAADVVIAIGGREGTQQVIEIARSVNKQLIPIPSFPGAARDAWPAARQSLAKQGMGSPLIGRLNHGFDVDAVVEAVNFCVSGQHRDPSGLLPVEEIWSALLRTGRIASNDEITGELLLFDNLEGRPQHTWLVATRDKVFFLLDDERTRAKNGLVQRTLDRDSLLPLSVDKSGHTVGFGSQPKPRWYYSPILFPTPDELTAAVESLVAGHRSA